MELALIIFTVGIVFWINQPSISKDKLMKIAKSIDKELSEEFKKRDNKIEELEKRLKRIEDTVVDKSLF